MIQFHVEMQDLREIEAALGMAKDKSKMVLRSAINNAVKETEERMVEEANERYAFHGRKSRIRKVNTIKKAKVSKMEATIEAKGKANELLDFQVKPRTYFPGGRGAPAWVKGRGRRDASLTKFARYPSAAGDKYKGFVVEFKSGHQAVIERVPGRRMRGKPHKEAIESLYSISTPGMERIVYEYKIDSDLYDTLERHIESQILKYLK